MGTGGAKGTGRGCGDLRGLWEHEGSMGTVRGTMVWGTAVRMDDLVGRTWRKGKLKRPRLLPRLPVEFRALNSEELMPC